MEWSEQSLLQGCKNQAEWGRKVPSGTLGHGKPGLGAAQRNVPELLALRPLLFLRLHGLCPAGGQGPEALSSWPLPVVRIVSQCLVEHFEEEGT